jgi:hypothetical protein
LQVKLDETLLDQSGAHPAGSKTLRIENFLELHDWLNKKKVTGDELRRSPILSQLPGIQQ